LRTLGETEGDTDTDTDSDPDSDIDHVVLAEKSGFNKKDGWRMTPG